MKLQRVKAYKLDADRWQYKYVIILPETTIQEVGWTEGAELKATAREGAIVLEEGRAAPRRPRRVIATKIAYPEFRDKVKETLAYSDSGLTWTQIRERLKLDQVVPNNKWVRQLEADIGLMRVKRADGTIVWRVNHVR